MFIRKYWIPLTVFLLAIVGVGLYYLQTRPPKDPIIIYKATPVEVEKPTAEAPAPKPPPPGASPNGHWHGDEWHDVPHETPAAPPVQNTEPPAPKVKPFANFTPDANDDPVTTAYKRLEYIKNNLHEWGQFSPQTLELMDKMTPVPNIRAGDVIPGEGESEIAYLEELSALRDPRSAEVLLAWQMDSGISGRPLKEALVAMGPASVPALIARLDDLSGSTNLLRPMKLLDPIIAEHRSELGGIVEHIIIPKLVAIAESNTRYQNAARHRVAELQQ